jgi:hypothetical protein
MLFVFLPVIASLIVVLMFRGVDELGAKISHFAGNGEFLLIAVAVVAPIAYIIQKDYVPQEKGANTFPHRTAFYVTFLLVTVLGAIVYGIREFAVVSKAEMPTSSAMQPFSYLIIVVAVALIYVCFVYKNLLEFSPASEMAMGDAKATKDWEDFDE